LEVIKVFGQGTTTSIINLDHDSRSLVCFIRGHGPEFSDTLALTPRELTFFHATPGNELLARRVIFTGNDLVDLCRGTVDYSFGRLCGLQLQWVDPERDDTPLDCVVRIAPALSLRRKYRLSVALRDSDESLMVMPISKALLDEVIRPWGWAIHDGGEFRWPRWLLGVIGPRRRRF